MEISDVDARRSLPDPPFYLKRYPDLTRNGLKSASDCVDHYLRHGAAEGRHISAAHEEDEAAATAADSTSFPTLAVCVHLGRSSDEVVDAATRDICARLRRMPPRAFDLFLTFDEFSVFDRAPARELLYCSGADRVVLRRVPNVGQDILPFLTVLREALSSPPLHECGSGRRRRYAAFLKLHTKSDARWRRIMLEAVLPQGREPYRCIEEAARAGHLVGSGAYAYRLASHTNNVPIAVRIARRCPEVWDAHADVSERCWDVCAPRIVADEDAPAGFDHDFYVHRHPDLCTLHQLAGGAVSRRKAWAHYASVRHAELDRLPNSGCVVERSAERARFFAGTMFWMGRDLASDAVRLLDASEAAEEEERFEPGLVKNEAPRVTHAWEDLFGLLACKGRRGAGEGGLLGRHTVTFLVPLAREPTSGGGRTLARMVQALHADWRFGVRLAFCGNEGRLESADQAVASFWNLVSYGEIRDAHRIDLANVRRPFPLPPDGDVNDDASVLGDLLYDADVVVATGWQTFAAAERTRGRARLAFFCQDLEYEFPQVKAGGAGLEAGVRAFYDARRRPFTITMSRWLAEKLHDHGSGSSRNGDSGNERADGGERMGCCCGQGAVRSIPFSVDTRVYYANPPLPPSPSGGEEEAPRDVLVYHAPSKPHRLPDLTAAVIRRLSDMPEIVRVHVFGEDYDDHALPSRSERGTPIDYYVCDGSPSAIANDSSSSSGRRAVTRWGGVKDVAALGRLYRSCAVGVVFSATNPSRLSFEMRACGMSVVELLGDSTSADLPDDQFCKVVPEATAVVERVTALLLARGAPPLNKEKDDGFLAELSSRDEATCFKRHVQEFLDMQVAADLRSSVQ